MKEINVKGINRATTGKKATKALRKEGYVPCNLYGEAKDADGKPSFYFRAAPQFEAPADSKYGWLNNSLFVCAPTFSPDFKGIVLNVWRVK